MRAWWALGQTGSGQGLVLLALGPVPFWARSGEGWRVCVEGVPSCPRHGDRPLPAQIQAPDAADIRILRGHQLSITCLVITPDDLAIFSAAKDCTIIKCE